MRGTSSSSFAERITQGGWCQSPPKEPPEGGTITSPKEHLKRGERQLARGAYERALNEFERAFEGDRSLLWAGINAGVALMHLKRHDEALRALARVISLAPRNAHAINAVGNVFIADKRYADALPAFDAALAEENTIAAIHYNRAVALHNLSRPDEAAASYRRAIELDPNVVVMHSGLGAVLMELGDFDEARSAFATALKRDPYNVETLHRCFDFR